MRIRSQNNILNKMRLSTPLLDNLIFLGNNMNEINVFFLIDIATQSNFIRKAIFTTIMSGLLSLILTLE